MATAASIQGDAAPSRPDRALMLASIVIVVGVLSTTLAQTGVLARLPLQNMLKNELHISRSASASFFFLAGLLWYFKPLAGIFTDAFPILGTRRRSYLLISTVLATACWLGLYFTPHRYGPLLWTCMLISSCMVFASVVIGGYMVEIAQAIRGTGRLTAIRQFVGLGCSLVASPAGGYLAAISFGWTAVACGGVMALLFPATLLFLREERKRVIASEVLADAGRQLARVGSAGAMWAAAGLSALFYVAPGLSTAFFYRQQDVLHMTTVLQGYAGSVGVATGFAAVLAYAYACRRINFRVLLLGSMAVAGAAHILFIYYTSIPRAFALGALDGFTFTLAELVMMDLAMRATPAGSEGLGFSLMMSARNLPLFATDVLGSNLLDHFHWTFNALVLANAAVMIASTPLMLLLPRRYFRARDAELIREEELYEPAPVPATQIET
ncbi:MAG TPA: MFS transporter [Caulobacteraceae bacterium]|nr:MFS transporter [Caulobacteraceae bacterium]